MEKNVTDSQVIVMDGAKSAATKRKAAYTRYSKELRGVLDSMDDTTRAVAGPLVADCARLRVIMDDCWQTYLAEGLTADYTNGKNQGGTREHPAIGSYIKCQRSLGANVAKLVAIVGRDSASSDTLTDFLSAAKAAGA